MSGMNWKTNAEAIRDRRRRYLNRRMQDGVLATLPVYVETSSEWTEFDRKWGTYTEGEKRPFPSNEEIYDRMAVGLEKRGQVEDDALPVVYSILDAGESMVCAMFDSETDFIHRPHGAAVSVPNPVLPDYSNMPDAMFSLNNKWTRRFLSIQEYFAEHMNGNFAQHPCLTMDALNFACEMRGATQSYLGIYEHPEELKALMEIGLDFNIRFQEAQMERIGNHADGCFVWLSGWAPFERAVSLSVDAYVICSVENYLEFGFDYQRRLIEHFGHGLLHFHCNRADLAAETAKLPGLRLFQYGGDTRDPVPSIDRLPEMRLAVGDIPIMVDCGLDTFIRRMNDKTLPPNVWYNVSNDTKLSTDEANRLMAKVRAYRA